MLFAEETTGGRLFGAFLDPHDPTVVTRVEERPQVGILRHEGIGVGPDGSVYVIDELNGGSIFRFVPERRGDLSEGQLVALRVSGLSDAEQKWSSTAYEDTAGAFEWAELDMQLVQTDANVAADARQRDRVRASRGRRGHRHRALRRLWGVEDNVPSDIWATQPGRDGDGAADSVDLFASLKDPGAEISGIYFGTDPRTLFFNVQHPEKALADGTWAITSR